MNTKEAIEEVEQVFWVKYGKFGNEKADQIIALLQRGEKYEKLLLEIGKLDFPRPSKNFTEKVMDKINKGKEVDNET